MENTAEPNVGGVIGLQYTSLRRLQLENALSPIEVTPSRIVTDSRLPQPQNASIPIEVTLLGIVIDVRLLQP